MVADGSTAVGYLLDTTTSLATGGAKVLKVANAGTEVFSVDKSGFIFETVGGAVASASTITPTGSVFHVTGTTTISTINPPYTGFTGCITIIPDGIFLTNTSGNIAIASTSVVSKAICFTYDGTKWYPTY